MKVRTKISAGFAGISLFCAAAIAVPMIITNLSELKKNIDRIAALEMNSIYKVVEDYIIGPIESVEAVINYMDTVGDPSREMVENYFIGDEEGEETYGMFYYASEKSIADGGVLYSDVHWDPPAGWDHTTRGWFINAKDKNGEPVLTDPYLDDRTGQPVMTLSEAYISEDEFKGVVGLDLKLEQLNNFLNKTKLSKNGVSFIFDKEGKYITNDDVNKIANSKYFEDFDLSSIREQLENEEEFFTDKYNGMFIYSKKLPEYTGWTLVAMGSVSDLYSTAYGTIIGSCIIAFIILVIAVVIGVLLSHSIVRPLKLIGKNLQEIASGNADLTKRIQINQKDEIGDVAAGFNKFTEKLQEIICQISSSKDVLMTAGDDLAGGTEDTSRSISEILENITEVHNQISSQGENVNGTAGAVNQIASNIQSLERMIENQSSGVTEASAAVEQMIGNISSVNSSVEKMAMSFDSLQTDAQKGSSKQQNVNEKISQIDAQSKMLQEANAAISAIAEQTNLLAMNAAIEAAHAGDAGKGFSVVADEIRKLSETSAVQSRTIGDQLTIIQNSIADVVEASNESSAAFVSVSEKIRDTDQLVRQIKSAMEEQQEGSKQILDSLQMMNNSTSEVKVASHEMAEGNKQILNEIHDLQSSTSVMTKSVEGMTASARKINETGAALTDVSNRMKEAITDIGAEIDLFTV